MLTHLILTPMAFLKAWLSASVLLISREKISLPASAVKGVSGPRDWAMPVEKKILAECILSYSIYLLLWWKHNLSQLHQCKATIWLPWEDNEIILCSGKPPIWPLPIAMAVFPVPGWPAISTALPAMWPSLIISRMTPAARREASWPTIPWDTCRWIRTGTLEAKFDT